MANTPDGKIEVWVAGQRFIQAGGRTFTCTFDPNTNQCSESLIQNTQHDMFCPGTFISQTFILFLSSNHNLTYFYIGTAVLPDTRVLISGGQNSARTTIYDPRDDSWNMAPLMKVPRGYHSTTVLVDGSVLAVGGSWSGGIGNKPSEVFDYQTETWNLKTGIIARGTLVTADIPFRSDNHMWLFTAPNGLVFQAGPSRKMHWMDVSGNGSVQMSGVDRGLDSMNGNAIMYDIGKLLTTGGSSKYEGGDLAHDVAHIIDINGPTIQLKELKMKKRRVFHNSAVLPNGQVVIMGGSSRAIVFNDDYAVLEAELFDPETETFTELAPMRIPRTYHSSGVLMKDGRIFIGGGGACGLTCPVNHFDAEIYTPPYLLDATGALRVTRPEFVAVSARDLARGDTFTVTMSGSSDIRSFALIRLGAATHATNCDLRRIPLTYSISGKNTYRLALPLKAGVMLPGTYWLFALDLDGTPSVGETITVRVG